MLHVIRHGRTEANAAGLLLGHLDPELDDVGKRQALAVARAGGVDSPSPCAQPRGAAHQSSSKYVC